MELVTVTTVNDAGQANVVRGVLEQAGIESAVSGGMISAYPMPAVNPFQILVREADAEAECTRQQVRQWRAHIIGAIGDARAALGMSAV